MQNMLITLFWRDLSLLFRKEEKKASFKPQKNPVARTCKGVTINTKKSTKLLYICWYFL